MCSDPTGGILDFCSVYHFFAALLPEGREWAAFALAACVLAFIVINGVVMATALYTWFERRAIGRFQSRLGPNRWGPYGLLQPFADIIKLITKEDVVPADADRPVFNAAPIALLLPTLLVLVVVPFGEDSFMGRLNIGILFIVGITSMTTVAIFMGGWASRNKYAMLGAMRGVAMLISYEVPMAIAITGVLLVSGTMAMSGIVASQHVPFLLVQPLAFLVFLAASVAEMSRTPFDQIEAESELGAGYHTEYSGAKFAIFQLAEFMAPIVGSIIIVTVFLGGTRGFDPVPGQVWVRRQGVCGGISPAVVPGHLAQAAHRPDHGLRMEGAVCPRGIEPLCGRGAGDAPSGPGYGRAHHGRHVDDGGDQLGDHDLGHPGVHPPPQPETVQQGCAHSLAPGQYERGG